MVGVQKTAKTPTPLLVNQHTIGNLNYPNYLRITSNSIFVQFYGYTILKLTKHSEKKLDGNYRRILKMKSWKQHSTKYSNLLLISQVIQGSRANNDDEVRSNTSGTLTHGRTCGPACKNLFTLISTDTGCCLEGLGKVMTDWDGWRVWYG